MSTPKTKPTSAIGTPEQQAQLAALYELEKQEDNFHSANGTKRTTPRLSEMLLRQIEAGPELGEIEARIAELDALIAPAEAIARDYTKIMEAVRAQVRAVQGAVTDRLTADLLRLAKGEDVDLMASAAACHPAAFLFLRPLDPRAFNELVMHLTWAVHRDNIDRLKGDAIAEFDVQHRLRDEIAERSRLQARRRELAPSVAERHTQMRIQDLVLGRAAMAAER